MSIKQQLKNWWKTIIIIATPLLLIPLITYFRNAASRCGYVILILVIYWATEAIPIPVTSLLPLILFPAFGVLTAREVARNYFRDIMSLLLGSVTLSFAIQNVNLHQRAALFVLNLVGSSIKWMLAGVMVTAWVLSMWINNAGTATLMLPIALAIADEFTPHSNTSIEEDESSKLIMESDEQQDDISKKKADNIRKSLVLAVAYSTTYGGSATIVGSSATMFLQGFIEEEYTGSDFHLTFFNYLLVALPATAIMLIFCWIWLQIRYGLIQWPCIKNRSSNQVDQHLEGRLKKQYNELGHFRWNEFVVSAIFFITLILWITRDLGKKYGGWSVLFRSGYVTNGTVALFIGVLILILPNDKPFTKNFKYQPIVTWNYFSKNFPWGTMILLGAGLSIAHASIVSKLTDRFGEAFEFMYDAPPLVILIMVIIISELFTQFISSVAMAGILLPAISWVSLIVDIHPAFLLIPCVLAVSQAFLLPISSQSNAIIFSTGFLRTRDLITTGIVLNIVGGLIIFVAATTWMLPIFGLVQSFSTHLTFINLTFSNSTETYSPITI